MPKGSSFKDMVALKGKPDIGEKINIKIIQPLINAAEAASRRGKSPGWTSMDRQPPPSCFSGDSTCSLIAKVEPGGIARRFKLGKALGRPSGLRGTYLREEIKAEGLVRSVENFSRFLEVAGFGSGEQLNYTAVANDAGVPARTVREHYQILVDTLLGNEIPAFQKTKKRKPVAVSKFYLFDAEVANVFKNVPAHTPGSASFGQALEHQACLELRAYLDYRRLFEPLTY